MRRGLKVLMINSFHHARGGDTTYTRALTRSLEAAGHTVVPLAMRHPNNDPSPWEQRFVSQVEPRAMGLGEAARAALRLAWSSEAARATEALVREVKPDIAHLQHVHRHLTPSVLAPLQRAGIPTVWTVHDYELICASGTLYTQGAPCERCLGHRYGEAVRHRCKWDSLGPSLAVAMEKHLHRTLGVWERVGRFLCPSRYMADALVRFGLPADRVRHLPNPLDTSRVEVGQDAGEGWLYAGRLAPEKGVEVALAAARSVPALLTVAGSGPDEARLRQRAPPNVEFLGHLPQGLLAARVRRTRAVIVPSLWPENFPYAVLEAQAAGRAVVASRTGGIPEQITDGEDGLLVPPGDVAALSDAVSRLMGDPALATRLGRAAAARVRAERRPDAHLAALLAIYAELGAAD